MQDIELIGYLAAAIHAVVPAYLDRPVDPGFANPKRVREALARLTREHRELVMLVLDGMIREHTKGHQARPLEANFP
jgi:hypothetical protein